MKKIFIITIILLATFGWFAVPVLAQNGVVPLAPLPGTENTEGRVDVVSYLPRVFTLMIGIAGVLAVLMIMIGGIQYLSTDAISGKQQGKERVQNALWGLLLALGSWVILATISPNLLRFDVGNVSQAPQAEGTIPVGSIGSTTPPGAGGGPEGDIWGPGALWPTDDSVRETLLSGSSGRISVNNDNCQRVGEAACTSLYNLGSRAVTGILTLENSCVAWNSACRVRISGGTEYWLHGNRSPFSAQNPTDHQPGGNAVDISLSHSAILNEYIRTFGTERPPGTSCHLSPNYRQWVLGGAVYVEEGNHWHICY